MTAEVAEAAESTNRDDQPLAVLSMVDGLIICPDECSLSFLSDLFFFFFSPRDKSN